MPEPTSIQADLNDPLYYLRNAHTLINWVSQRHGDLLDQHECDQLERFRSVPEPAQALLIRMVMRRGEYFRTDQLEYAELADINRLLGLLADAELIQPDPQLNTDELGSLLRKAELWQLCATLAPDSPPSRSLRKQELQDWLSTHYEARRLFSHWLPDAGFEVVALNISPLMQRLRLMFFGNLHQDWSEFVVTELGHQRYEPVPLDAGSRAFQQRDEVDAYLQLADLQQQLDSGADLTDLVSQLPQYCPNDWLEHRRRKLAFALGHAAERSGEVTLARQLYASNPHRDAQLRHLRLQELNDKPEDTFANAQQLLNEVKQPEARLRIERILQRTGKKAGHKVAGIKRPSLQEQTLILPADENLRVERLVIDELSDDDQQAWHVENRLFNGLFALLLWPALYSPEKGAFFHPFQAGPADLYRPDFFQRREALVEMQLAQLKTGEYRQTIAQYYRQKQGIRCSLIHWPSLPLELVTQALELIPADHLEAVFRHLMLDLRHHRRGMPDLICFDTRQHEYRLIEVKGPGDRLQDHQRLWMEFFMRQGIPASLCLVEHH